MNNQSWEPQTAEELLENIEREVKRIGSLTMNYRQIGMYKRPMNFFEKLAVGWWWFWECMLEWIWCMTHPEDNGGDFFCHICSDYVAYEEETYYNGK